jgi:hypothetical protein
MPGASGGVPKISFDFPGFSMVLGGDDANTPPNATFKPVRGPCA